MHPKKHKKLNIFLAIFILFLGVGVGGYLVLESNFGSASNIAAIINGQVILKTPAPSCSPNPSDQGSDADNDGLKDWQETQIYHTDPCNPDTDGDGYLDGEEVASGYNPLVKAPDDKLASNKSTDPRPAPKTLTGQLAAQIVENLMSGRMTALPGNASSAVDQNQVNSLVGESLDSLIASADAPNFIVDWTTIPDKDIKIINDNSDETRGKYLLQIADITLSRFSAQTTADNANGNEENQENFAIALRAIQSNNFSELDNLIQNYRDSAELLKQTETPSSKKDFHKSLIAYMQSCANIFGSIKLVKDDPLKTVLAFRQYQDLVKKTFEPIIKMVQEKK